MNEPLDFHAFLCASEFVFFFVLFGLTNKLLNIREGFILSYFYALVCLGFFIYCLFPFSGHSEKLTNWYLILPVLNLSLYKLMDNYILKKFKRHLNFSYRGSLKNDQSWREWFFQMFLTCTTILVFIYILEHKK